MMTVVNPGKAYGIGLCSKTSQDLNANETIWSFLATKKLEVKSGTDKSGTDSSPNVK
jgi:hypothetical protein